MKRVLLMSRYGRTGASSRVRSYQYLPYLEAHGYQVTVGSLLDDDYVHGLYRGNIPSSSVVRGYLKRLRDMLRAGHFDLVWVEKEMLPWLPASIERAFLRGSAPIVVDYDDALFHRYDQHRSPVVRRLLGRKIDAVMRHADLVIAGNEYLKDRAVRAGARDVRLLPTVVDTERYAVAARAAGNPLTIGWIGSPITLRYLDLVMPVLREMTSVHSMRVIAIGASQTDSTGIPVEARRWSEDSEISELQQCDIGIMPLPDSPWERGKCGYKLIQYMACGIPVVASPVGMNRVIIEDGINGYLANTIEEWRRALNTLREQPELRRSMGQEGRAKVEQRYSLHVAAPELAKFFDEAMLK